MPGIGLSYCHFQKYLSRSKGLSLSNSHMSMLQEGLEILLIMESQLAAEECEADMILVLRIVLLWQERRMAGAMSKKRMKKSESVNCLSWTSMPSNGSSEEASHQATT